MRIGRLIIGMDLILVLALFYILDTSGLFLLSVIAATVHEAGHIIMMRLLGIELREIRLSAVGARIETTGMIGYKGEIAIASAGPFAGAILAVITAGVGCTALAGVSAVLTVFNLLPALPLDGGRILKFTALLLLSERRQRFISLTGNALSAVFLIVLCIFISIKAEFSPSLCIFCTFVAANFLKEFF